MLQHRVRAWGWCSASSVRLHARPSYHDRIDSACSVGQHSISLCIPVPHSCSQSRFTRHSATSSCNYTHLQPTGHNASDYKLRAVQVSHACRQSLTCWLPAGAPPNLPTSLYAQTRHTYTPYVMLLLICSWPHLPADPGVEGDSLQASHAQQGTSCEALSAAAQLQRGCLLEVAEQLHRARAFPAQAMWVFRWESQSTTC